MQSGMYRQLDSRMESAHALDDLCLGEPIAFTGRLNGALLACFPAEKVCRLGMPFMPALPTADR